MFSNIKTLFFFAKSYNFLACQEFKHIGFSTIKLKPEDKISFDNE